MGTFEELYNSEKGIVSIIEYDNVNYFESDKEELEENLDFTSFGAFNSIQDINEEFEYQGFTFDEITKMNMSQYGNVIEVLQEPKNGTYWVFVGMR